MTESGGAVKAVPAAALIVVRPAVPAPEILLLKRSARARFMPNAHVFPGGAVDALDQGAGLEALCAGLDEAAASRALGKAAQGLGYFVAAVRETFEECGLLYAYVRGATLASQADADTLRQALGAQITRGQGGAAGQDGAARQSLGDTGFAAACAGQGWRLATDRLSFFGHWITPPRMPRRFDTRFFLARAPEAQSAALVSEEMQQVCWLSAREALARQVRRELLLMTPTQALLEELAAFADLGALLEYARAPRLIEPITPP